MDTAGAVIAKLGLQPHPEGGWYRETWRASAAPGARSAGTSILFLLEPGQGSHWHRVDADELWLFQAGSPLLLSTAESGRGRLTTRLGPDVADGQDLQQIVPAGVWQSAAAPSGWSLVACVVIPGFEFAGFDLAPPGWSPD